MGQVITIFDRIKKILNLKQESSNQVRYLKGKPFDLKEVKVEPNNVIDVEFNSEKPFMFPDYCQDTYDCLNKNGTMKTLEQMMKATGKTKMTIHHEMSQIRKSGITILKEYDKSKKEYLYFFPGE